MFLCDGLFGEFVVVVCEFNELYCVCVCEGSKGVGMLFGIWTSIQRIYGLSMA